MVFQRYWILLTYSSTEDRFAESFSIGGANVSFDLLSSDMNELLEEDENNDMLFSVMKPTTLAANVAISAEL